MTCALWHHVEILHFCSARRRPRSVIPPLRRSKGRIVFITRPVHDQYCRVVDAVLLEGTFATGNVDVAPDTDCCWRCCWSARACMRSSFKDCSSWPIRSACEVHSLAPATPLSREFCGAPLLPALGNTCCTASVNTEPIASKISVRPVAGLSRCAGAGGMPRTTQSTQRQSVADRRAGARGAAGAERKIQIFRPFSRNQRSVGYHPRRLRLLPRTQLTSYKQAELTCDNVVGKTATNGRRRSILMNHFPE